MQKKGKTDTAQLASFPPVITVLGHVDHGKTTLLDVLRNTSIAKRETGGITQKIGASSIEIMHEDKKRKITLIDTPGHALFSHMRSRGAQAADIGLLVVAATDGVMPQTKESIALLKQTGIPFIVVFTKSDLATKNIEKAKQQLAAEEVLLEGIGGDIPFIEVSATTNLHIKELLDLILLVWDMHTPEQKNLSETGELKAIVIESKLDQKAGPRATVVIKNGTIQARDMLYSESQEFRVRSLISDMNVQIKTATIGDAVELLGFDTVPEVGSMITNQKTTVADVENAPLSKEMIYQSKGPDDRLSVVINADTQGSLEAILAAFPQEVDIISKKTGETTEADILLAKSTGAIILSFNTTIRPAIAKLASTEKVLARNYSIIYEMLDEIKDVLEGKKLALIEEIYGTAQVLAKFPFEKGFALGIKVTDGRVARGDKVRIMRGDTIIGESSITSLRVGKNPTSKVEKGNEAGITIAPVLDFSLGDMVISHG